MTRRTRPKARPCHPRRRSAGVPNTLKCNSYRHPTLQIPKATDANSARACFPNWLSRQRENKMRLSLARETPERSQKNPSFLLRKVLRRNPRSPRQPALSAVPHCQICLPCLHWEVRCPHTPCLQTLLLPGIPLPAEILRQHLPVPISPS